MNIPQEDMSNRDKFIGWLNMMFHTNDMREGIECYINVKDIMRRDDLLWEDLIVPEGSNNGGNGLNKNDWVILDNAWLEEDRTTSYKIRFKQFNGSEAFGYYSKDYTRKKNDGRWEVKRWLKDAQNKTHSTNVAFSEI